MFVIIIVLKETEEEFIKDVPISFSDIDKVVTSIYFDKIKGIKIKLINGWV